MICKTVKELIDSINYCCYVRNIDFEGGEVYVCNLCGNTMLSLQDMIEHLMLDHENDTIPDVNPSNIEED